MTEQRDEKVPEKSKMFIDKKIFKRVIFLFLHFATHSSALVGFDTRNSKVNLKHGS